MCKMLIEINDNSAVALQEALVKRLEEIVDRKWVNSSWEEERDPFIRQLRIQLEAEKKETLRAAYKHCLDSLKNAEIRVLRESYKVTLSYSVLSNSYEISGTNGHFYLPQKLTGEIDKIVKPEGTPNPYSI